jgi:radical SAM protein with 4Fe4S-binding SPASM domain
MKVFRLKRYSETSKGIFSFVTSSAFKKPVIWGMPFSAGIELTNCCNLACPECASGSGEMSRPKGFMNSDLFDKIIGERDSGLIYANLYFQGEPMMHPEFFIFVSKASHLKLTVSTNGHFITEDGARKLANSSLERLIVSIDGMDNETYLLYRRNGDFEKVTKGVRMLSEEIKKQRSSLKLELQFLVNRYNESQIVPVRKFAGEVGATLRLKSMQVINRNNEEFWMPGNEKYRRYLLSDDNYRIKSSLRNRCSRLWFNPVITWDGLVVPCCFDKNADHVMGDMKVSSLREIWYGERYMDFRRSLLNDRSNIAICRNCTTGLKGVKV